MPLVWGWWEWERRGVDERILIAVLLSAIEIDWVRLQLHRLGELGELTEL